MGGGDLDGPGLGLRQPQRLFWYLLAVGLIVVGGLWSLFAGMRERRAEAVEE